MIQFIIDLFFQRAEQAAHELSADLSADAVHRRVRPRGRCVPQFLDSAFAAFADPRRGVRGAVLHCTVQLFPGRVAAAAGA